MILTCIALKVQEGVTHVELRVRKSRVKVGTLEAKSIFIFSPTPCLPTLDPQKIMRAMAL